jgi:hypothetical protein
MPPGKRRKVAQMTACQRYVRQLRRTRVRDDGSCWIWAVLACLNRCEHAVVSGPVPDASAADLEADRALRNVLHEQYGRPESILKSPNYLERGDDFFGSYGSSEEFLALAKHFGVDIVCMNENKFHLEDERWSIYTRNGHEFLWYPTMIQKHTTRRVVLHVAYSSQTDSHYEAYVNPSVTFDEDLSLGNPIRCKCTCGKDPDSAATDIFFSGSWIQCGSCERWCHSQCYESSDPCVTFTCSACSESVSPECAHLSGAV